MATELPYFRFTVQEWQNGDISLERYELQGFFISVCGFYWLQDCNVTLAILQKKFSNATILLQELIELNILKHENRHDKVEIVFLNKQYDLLSEKRKLRQIAGSKGGNAKAMLKQKGSYKDKDKDNNKDKDKDKAFDTLLSIIKTKLGKTFNSKKEVGNFNARLNEGFTIEQFEQAIENIKNDPYHIETGYKHITPEFICRVNKLEKFINASSGTAKKEPVNFDFNDLYKTDK